MGKIKVFLDTDVVISALLSKTGASFEIIQSTEIKNIISGQIEKEVLEVSKRLNIKESKAKSMISLVKITSLKENKKNITKKYGDFVLDKKDSHVVAGSVENKINFILTHNIRHYKVDRIKAEFGIKVLRPGRFLQFLRSIGKY